MQIQQKKSKGISLLELLVVVMIIGLVSSLAFLPFQKWRSDRMVKAVAVESGSVIQSIFSQVQRGHYSFVLFRVHKGIGEDSQKWFLSSYGMETENFTTLLRNKYTGDVKRPFHVFETRCQSNLTFDGQLMWNDQGYPINSSDEESKKLTVTSIEIDDKISLGVPGVTTLSEGTVCFSNDGSYYAVGGMFLNPSEDEESELMGCEAESGSPCPSNDDVTIVEELFVCQNDGTDTPCSVEAGQKNFYSVKWGRFGNVEMQKLN